MYQLGDIVNDRYEVSGILSPLPLGPLFRAVQRRTNLHVFLWVLGPDTLPDQAARQNFIQQLTRSYGVRHPNAVPLVDLFADRDRVVLVLQYVEGPSVDAHVERRSKDGTPLLRAEAWVAIEQVASACSQYHQVGLTIAVLRPELVLMTGAGAMLLDPAVALAVPRKRLLSSLKRRGRWHYLAPEVRAGWPCDRRSDVYSLAALAHLILYATPHGWPDGARRGLFAKMGHRLRFGGRPKQDPDRWPLVDQVLRHSLAGAARDRAPDVESFCGMLHQALSSSPERQRPKPAPVQTQSKSPLLQSVPQNISSPSLSPSNTGARTVQVDVPRTYSVQASPPPPAAPPPPAGYVPASRPEAATVAAFDAPATHLLNNAPPAGGFDAPETHLLNQPAAAAPSEDVPTAIATPHARHEPAPSDFDAPRTVENAPSPTDFDAPSTVASLPPVVEAPSHVIEMEGLRTMELLAMDVPPPRPTPAPRPAPAPAPAPAPVAAPPLQAPRVASPTGENKTLQVNVSEIATLLAASQSPSPADDKNKTREINSAEIEALLARTRDENSDK